MKVTTLIDSLIGKITRLSSGKPEQVIFEESYCEHHHLSDYYCTKE